MKKIGILKDKINKFKSNGYYKTMSVFLAAQCAVIAIAAVIGTNGGENYSESVVSEASLEEREDAELLPQQRAFKQSRSVLETIPEEITAASAQNTTVSAKAADFDEANGYDVYEITSLTEETEEIPEETEEIPEETEKVPEETEEISEETEEIPEETEEIPEETEEVPEETEIEDEHVSLAGAYIARGSTETENAYANEVFELVNEIRAQHGLSPYSELYALDNAALERAWEISCFNSHTRPDGSSCKTVLTEYGVSFVTYAENIAYISDTPQRAVNSWMNAGDAHTAAILSDKFTSMGVGCVYNNGNWYWVQLFIV